jgi:hypothetical protein
MSDHPHPPAADSTTLDHLVVIEQRHLAVVPHGKIPPTPASIKNSTYRPERRTVDPPRAVHVRHVGASIANRSNCRRRGNALSESWQRSPIVFGRRDPRAPLRKPCNPCCASGRAIGDERVSP